MDRNDWKRIDDIVIACTEALFGDFGVPVRHAPDGHTLTPWSHTLAVIGFGGRQLRGSMVLSAPEPALCRSFPLSNPGSLPSSDDLRDWSGELVNQLVGRIKIRLLSHGVVIEPSTPTALSGFEFRIGAATNDACVPHRFEANELALHVRFEAIAASDVVLNPIPSEPLAVEGDMLFF